MYIYFNDIWCINSPKFENVPALPFSIRWSWKRSYCKKKENEVAKTQYLSKYVLFSCLLPVWTDHNMCIYGVFMQQIQYLPTILHFRHFCVTGFSQWSCLPSKQLKNKRKTVIFGKNHCIAICPKSTIQTVKPWITGLRDKQCRWLIATYFHPLSFNSLWNNFRLLKVGSILKVNGKNIG